jgi:hypothetical protein
MTSHTSHLNTTFPSDVILHFPSIPSIVSSSGLGFFDADIMKPKSISQPPLDPDVRVAQHPSMLPPFALYGKSTKITHVLLHQCLGHIYDDVPSKMCQNQTLTGLPKNPPHNGMTMHALYVYLPR